MFKKIWSNISRELVLTEDFIDTYCDKVDNGDN